ncbi:hypothetical protein ACIBMZ_26505 [Micromonospora sp. NPDC049900]|uniref:hypothetical protein n=1 Tax=Micromonospora sp. NPDC049900 TaxID=3364275 RepID=UPI0037B6B044
MKQAEDRDECAAGGFRGTGNSLDALGGWVLDVGALVAFAKADTFVGAMVASCRRRGQTVLVCDTSFALAAEAVPQYTDRLLDLVQEANTWLAELAAADRVAVDALLPRAGGDLSLAHLVYEAARRGYPVLSDRRADVLAVDGELFVEAA